MTKAAYIGILTPGSTSRMRAEWLRRLTPDWEWEWLDTDPPLVATSRISQSLAYRFQFGSGVDRINEAVMEWLTGKSFQLAWVDKAIFLRPETITRIREASRRLVHFTPDTAFHANKSRNFEATIESFDLLVTTKSFEVDEYRRRLVRDTLFVTTQGFDPEVHYPRNTPDQRSKEVAFVGLAEPYRESCLATLLQHSIPIVLAGHGWNSFRNKWRGNANLRFGGESLFGDDYARLLSRAWIGLGLLSKRFPELHTTRTFEIPACGALLATERNSETETFFSDDEALFFRDPVELATRIAAIWAEDAAVDLKRIAANGRVRVIADKRDYPSILGGILSDSRIN